MNSARAKHFKLCQVCRLLCQDTAATHCARCNAPLHFRKPDSLARTWALVLTAIILLVPANTIPIMDVMSFGKHDPSTILSGILKLWRDHQFLIAIIVFVASFIVPLFKLGALVMLLLAAHQVFPTTPVRWTKLYRFLEFIGRWSMLDIFVVTLMVAVVQLGNVSRVIAGGGSFAFTLVVIVTMIASSSFDPRLLWDKKASSEPDLEMEKHRV